MYFIKERDNTRRFIPAAAGSEQQLHSNVTSENAPELSTATSNTLTSAYRALGDSHRPSGIYVRTRYGYNQESLPSVETIPPKIRRSIVEVPSTAS